MTRLDGLTVGYIKNKTNSFLKSEGILEMGLRATLVDLCHYSWCSAFETLPVCGESTDL